MKLIYLIFIIFHRYVWMKLLQGLFEDRRCSKMVSGFTEEIARDKLGIQGLEAEVLKILASISGCDVNAVECC